MRIITGFALFAINSISVAMPAIGAYIDELGGLIVAMDDGGNLFESTTEGWVAVWEGGACPGVGPYRIELVKMESVDEAAFILVFDSEGRLFQPVGTEWTTLMDPVEGTVPPCQALLLSATESDLAVMLVDSAGYVFIGMTGSSWQSIPEKVSSAPVLDLAYCYDDSAEMLYPFLLDADGRLCGYVDESWESSEFVELPVELIALEVERNPETGFVIMVAIDESGNIYDNLVSGKLALSENAPCPGDGPWELKLSYNNGNGAFDLFCIDYSGCLHIANSGSWDRIADSFPSPDME